MTMTAAVAHPARGLATLALACLLLMLAATARAEVNFGLPAEERRMQVLLDDREVGLHTFRFDEREGTLQVRSEAEFRVRLAFVTLFRYEHEAEELWRGGCLVGLRSKTDENGTKFEVQGERSDAGLAVQTRAGEHEVAADCPWSFAYWTPSLRERELLVNPQDGAMLEVDFEHLGKQALRIGDRETEVDAWKLRGRNVTPGENGDAEVGITIFYDSDDRWVGLDSPVANGRTLRYRPAADDIAFPSR